MPKMSKDSVTVIDHGPVLDWNAEMDGYTVDIVQFKQDVDHGPLLRGLPDDRCQCPHWGYILSGQITMRYADHEETYVAGDAFYAPPGHVPIGNEPGTELLQFSPTDALAETNAALMKNLAAMQAAH